MLVYCGEYYSVVKLGSIGVVVKRQKSRKYLILIVYDTFEIVFAYDIWTLVYKMLTFYFEVCTF
jgi:hypothetical protein